MRVEGAWFMVHGAGGKVWGLGFRIQGSGDIWGVGVKVSGLGLSASGLEIPPGRVGVCVICDRPVRLPRLIEGLCFMVDG